MEDKYLYEIHPVKPIKGINENGTAIRRPCTMMLTEEQVKQCLSCGSVWRKYKQERIRVIGNNITDLHCSNPFDKKEIKHIIYPQSIDHIVYDSFSKTWTFVNEDGNVTDEITQFYNEFSQIVKLDLDAHIAFFDSKYDELRGRKLDILIVDTSENNKKVDKTDKNKDDNNFEEEEKETDFLEQKEEQSDALSSKKLESSKTSPKDQQNKKNNKQQSKSNSNKSTKVILPSTNK